MLQTLDRSGLVKLGLPDFSRLRISNINGDYVFKKGTMEIKTFEITGPEMTLNSIGTVGLAGNQALNVEVNLHTPKPTMMGEMDLKLKIDGTLSQPKTNLDHLKKKAFKATIRSLGEGDAGKEINKALKNLFR